jgi:transcriptional regulator with XRE-family HTH domain
MDSNSYIKNYHALSDSAIVKEIGKYLKQMRLNKNFTQQHLADVTGLDRVTISKVENGRAATMITFVQLLRALDKLELLSTFNETPEISPLQVAEAQEKYRKRASQKGKIILKSKAPSEW